MPRLNLESQTNTILILLVWRHQWSCRTIFLTEMNNNCLVGRMSCISSLFVIRSRHEKVGLPSCTRTYTEIVGIKQDNNYSTFLVVHLTKTQSCKCIYESLLFLLYHITLHVVAFQSTVDIPTGTVLCVSWFFLGRDFRFVGSPFVLPLFTF